MSTRIGSYFRNFGVLNTPGASSLLNQMASTGLVVSILLVITCYGLDLSRHYLISTAIIGFSLIVILGLNWKKRFYASKAFTAFIFPLLISGSIISLGGNFSEYSIFTVLFFLIFIFYEQNPRLKFFALAFLSLHVIGVTIYLYIFPPLFGVHDFPYDNFFVFAGCVIWLLRVLGYHLKRILEEKERQAELIEILQQKNEHLKKTTEALEQFTYIASHDLKSPVQTILSFSELIERDLGKKSYEALPTKVEFVKTAAQQARRLITDILEFTHIHQGVDKKMEIVNLTHLAEKVQVNLTNLIQDKNAHVIIENLYCYPCRESEMSIVFQNLIENGIKYNQSETPTILVDSKYEKGYHIIEFSDNGIGIEATYFDRIFEYFKRLHAQDAYEGTGLGLGLCKKIVDAMGGKIDLESSPGIGSTFRVYLPVEAVFA